MLLQEGTCLQAGEGRVAALPVRPAGKDMKKIAAAWRGKDPGVFSELVGKSVRASYRDEGRIRTCHGTLLAAENGFLTIDGEKGVQVIATDDLIKVEEER